MGTKWIRERGRSEKREEEERKRNESEHPSNQGERKDRNETGNSFAD